MQVKRKKSSEWLVVALKNGRLVVSLRGKKKEHQLSSSAAVNDGHWHKVTPPPTPILEKSLKNSNFLKFF